MGEVGLDGSGQEGEDIAALLAAGFDHRQHRRHLCHAEDCKVNPLLYRYVAMNPARTWTAKVTPVDGTRFPAVPGFSAASADRRFGSQPNAARMPSPGSCFKNRRVSNTARSNKRFLTIGEASTKLVAG